MWSIYSYGPQYNAKLLYRQDPRLLCAFLGHLALCPKNVLFRTETPGVHGLSLVQSNSPLKTSKAMIAFNLHCQHIKDELSKPGQLRMSFYIPEYEACVVYFVSIHLSNEFWDC